MQNIQIIESGRKLLKALANRDNITVQPSNSELPNNSLVTYSYHAATKSYVVFCRPQTIYNSKAWMMQLFNTAMMIHEKSEKFIVNIEDDVERLVYQVLLGNKLFKEVSGFAGVDQAVAEVIIDAYHKLMINGRSIVGDLVAWDISVRRKDGHPVYSREVLHDFSGTLPDNLTELVDQAQDYSDLHEIVKLILGKDDESGQSGTEGNQDKSDDTQADPSPTNGGGDSGDPGDNQSDGSGDNQKGNLVGSQNSDSGDNQSDDSVDNQKGDSGDNSEGNSTPSIGSPINNKIVQTVYPNANSSSGGKNDTLDYSSQQSPLCHKADYTPSLNPTFVTHETYMLRGVDERFCSQVTKLIAGSKLSNRIRKKLLAFKVVNWRSQYKTGRIDTRRLHKLITTGEQKVFKRREEPVVDTNTAVQLIVDYSGSMRNSYKIQMATAAAYQIGRVMQQLQIPYEIIGFTDHPGNMLMYVIKDFSENIKLPVLLKRLCSSMILRNMQNNSDGDTLIEVYPRLAYRQESKKIMIVLSDGAPAGYYIGDGRVYLKTVVKQIEYSGEVDIYGIGIRSDLVSRFYSNHIVINNIETLDSELLSLITDKIVRG